MKRPHPRIAFSGLSIPYLYLLMLLIGLLQPARALGAALTIPEDIKSSMRQRVDKGYNVGISIGITNGKESTFYSYGKASLSDARKLNERTVFEIGSVTKVFTSLLLAEMVEAGEVSLNDPIKKFLPEDTKVPADISSEITLIQLATHTSGLPRLPDNLVWGPKEGPYAGYTEEQLYAALADCHLPSPTGHKYEYSNLGVGLLGHLLARSQNMPFPELLRKRITDPLGLVDTGFSLPSGEENRLAQGYCGTSPVSTWDLGVLEAAGGLRSTAADLLQFVALNIDGRSSPLFKAIERSQVPRYNIDSNEWRIGLGWEITTAEGEDVYWHNGMTGGYFCFIGFNKAKGYGIAILTNTMQSVDDIGLHFLLKNYPLGDYSAPPTTCPVVELALLPGEKLPAAEDVLRQNIEQSGGAQALEGVEGRIIKGTIQMEQAGFKIDGPMLLYQLRSGQFYSKTELSGLGTIEQGFNGEVLWEHSTISGDRVITGRERDVFLVNNAFDITNWKDLYSSVKCDAKVQMTGRSCLRVVCTPTISTVPPIVYYFAEDSKELVGCDYPLMEGAKVIQIRRWNEDFRPVDHILYPYVLHELSETGLVTTRLQSIEHTTSMPAEYLKVPDGISKMLRKKEAQSMPTTQKEQ